MIKKFSTIFLCVLFGVFFLFAFKTDGQEIKSESFKKDVLDKTFPKTEFLKFLKIIKKAENNPAVIIKGNKKNFYNPGLYFRGLVGMFKNLPDHPVVIIEYEDSDTPSGEMFGDVIAFILLLPDAFNKFRNDFQKTIDEDELIRITMNILKSNSGFIIVDFRYYNSANKERHFWPNPVFFQIDDVKNTWAYPEDVINSLWQ